MKTQPSREVALEDVHRRIAKELDDNAEGTTESIALNVWTDLTVEERLTAGRAAFNDYVRTFIRRERETVLRQSNPPAPSTKWENVKLVRARGLLDARYSVGKNYVRLGDCTADDLAVIRDGYAQRVAENSRFRKVFDKLLNQVRTQGVQKVSELPLETVETIFHS